MALSFQQLSLAETIDFKALSVKTEYEVDNSKTAGGNIDIVKDTISLLPTVICAFINPWLTLAVGGGTILVKRFAKTKNGERQEVLVKEKKTDISHQISDNEIDAIIESIYNICEEIDGIIAKIQRDRADILAQMQYKVDNCTIDHMYPQILTSIQYLAKEQLESETENPNINNLIFSLQGYGYEVVEYNPSTAGFFIKKVNPNVTEESMYLPAIIKDVKGTKVVASEGIVFIPAAVQ